MKWRLAVLALLVAAVPASHASSRAERARGDAIFTACGCAHCHSIEGVGGHKGPDLSDVGRRMKKDRLRMQIVYGSKRMPPFGEDLENAQIKDLIAYLHSCRDKKRR